MHNIILILIRHGILHMLPPITHYYPPTNSLLITTCFFAIIKRTSQLGVCTELIIKGLISARETGIKRPWTVQRGSNGCTTNKNVIQPATMIVLVANID